MSEMLSFGAWLKQRRHRLDLTQQAVAQRAACSLSTLRKIESDDLLPSKELAQLLAVALGVPATEQEAFITFTPENAAAVAQICAWLDGLSLAIEMAAARVKWQPPAVLLEQLRKQLMALTGGPRNLTPRQQTLRGALDWSYNLLTPLEQQLWIALGVINGSVIARVAAAFAQNSEALAILLEDDKAVRTVLQYRASIVLNQSDYPQAMRCYQQALDLCDTTASDDQKAAAAILNGMGLIAKDQGDYECARALHAQSYTLYAQRHHPIGMARSLTYSSIAAYWQGNFHQAIDLAQQVITLQQGIGDVVSMSYSREIMAVALVKLRRFAEGVQALEESLAEFEKLEDQTGVAMVLVDLGQAAYAQQAYAQSLQYHHRALQIAYTIGEQRRCAFALEGMAMAYAHLSVHHNHLTEAVRLAAALRTKIAIPLPETDRPDYETCLALVAQGLSPLAYQSAWQQGCEAPLDQFVRAAPVDS